MLKGPYSFQTSSSFWLWLALSPTATRTLTTGFKLARRAFCVWTWTLFGKPYAFATFAYETHPSRPEGRGASTSTSSLPANAYELSPLRNAYGVFYKTRMTFSTKRVCFWPAGVRMKIRPGLPAENSNLSGRAQDGSLKIKAKAIIDWWLTLINLLIN